MRNKEKIQKKKEDTDEKKINIIEDLKSKEEAKASSTTEIAKAKHKVATEKATKDERQAKFAAKKESTKRETIEKRATDEDTTKEAKEDKEEWWKRYEEALNNDTSPMDTNLPNSSMEVPNSQPQFGGMELGLCALYKPNKVVNLKTFKYDKTTCRIMQQHIINVPSTGGTPLEVLTKNIMTEYANQYLLSIASTGTSFTTVT